MSLVITTPSGSRTVEAYRVISDPIEVEVSADVNRAGFRVVKGDRGRRPLSLDIEVEVHEATVGLTMNQIDQILSEAQNASSLTLPRGTRAVDGLLESIIRPGRGAQVTLLLRFHPTGGSYA